MAPKTFYDAAEMQAKANQAAEKEIRILGREGAELPRSAEVTCEYRPCAPPLGTCGLIATTKSTLLKSKKTATTTP